ncbi:hypothetical protein L6452_22485 [Arctium lappa]|uniref:Uncharacterized protein n=1 Tax=Arctium lappa TaxID=4217 RepID=A0ACB9B0K4_ARCLA|nr:hypothetical protein L6452_22485 [Arctium lappa]
MNPATPPVFLWSGRVILHRSLLAEQHTGKKELSIRCYAIYFLFGVNSISVKAKTVTEKGNRIPLLATFADLLERDSVLHGRQFSLKYQVSSEDLDSIVSVTIDEDLDNMVDEYDRLNSSNPSSKPLRLCLFLFLLKPETTASMGWLLDDAKSETCFVDALNGAGFHHRGLSDSTVIDNLLEPKDGEIQEDHRKNCTESKMVKSLA